MVAMMALCIQPGDEVITTPFTFIANAEMIAILGAKPVFVDINPDTFNIDAAKIESAITPKTRCIMPVSLYGQCADMDAINAIAKQYNLSVIEDAAQSFGATYKNKKSCSLSTIACTSFFPSKPLGCYGDGGACFTDDDKLNTIMRQIRVHGQEKRYHHPVLGLNSRLDTLQATILLAKLSIFDQEIEKRAQIAKRYNQLLQNHVKTIYVPSENTCVYAQYTIEVPNRDDVGAYLKENGIPTAIHYPVPLNLQPVFSKYITAHVPVAEKAAKHVISLPMHPYLTEEEQDLIVNNLLNKLQIDQLSDTRETLCNEI
jgi:UDP-2-acetamido-2-deoxy-ribo-hexuluronate aminotransferase